MKFSAVALGATLSTSALAFPGMKGDAGMMDFHKSLVRKAHSGSGLNKRDVAPFPPGLTNATNLGAGKQIKDCLNGDISCEAEPQKTYVAPALGSSDCDADKCCVWDYVVKDLVALFTDSDGKCSEPARQAIRLGFHDAGAWSVNSGIGGADGSVLISDEVNRPENKGLQNIVATGQSFLSKYNVGAADLVQMMSNVATVVCPLGPRVLTFVGRTDSPDSPEDLLPGAFSDSDTLISLFQEKTISPGDLVALVGAHTTSHQDFVDPSNAGSFQDSTPGVWDTAFYAETLDDTFSESDVTKFPSDINLAKDSRTNGAWKAMSNQGIWNAAYARAYVRLSILGVSGIDKLTDCSKVLPSVKNGGPPGGSGSGSTPSGSAKPAGSAKASGSGKGSKPTGSGKGGKPTASVSGKPYGGGYGDDDVTTTVTSYFTKNGWHVPVHTSVCNKDQLPAWASTPEWTFPGTVTAWAIPDAPAPTSAPKAPLIQPACIVKTVYVTTTVW